MTLIELHHLKMHSDKTVILYSSGSVVYFTLAIPGILSYSIFFSSIISIVRFKGIRDGKKFSGG